MGKLASSMRHYVPTSQLKIYAWRPSRFCLRKRVICIMSANLISTLFCVCVCVTKNNAKCQNVNIKRRHAQHLSTYADVHCDGLTNIVARQQVMWCMYHGSSKRSRTAKSLNTSPCVWNYRCIFTRHVYKPDCIVWKCHVGCHVTCDLRAPIMKCQSSH